jgi:hypothetical protein
MTTVKDLREFLAGLPDDTVVEVLQEFTSGWSTGTRWADLDLAPYSDNCETLGGTLYLGES